MHAYQMTPEQRAADKAAKLEERLGRRKQLKLTVVQDFLRGKISFEQISQGGWKSTRAYPRLDKILVAWTLILARPQTFNFRLVDKDLVGSFSRALEIIYPDDIYIADESLKYGLHVQCKGGVRATPSVALAELVHTHIGTPKGGIAQYFTAVGQLPPSKLDIDVIKAVCAPEDLAAFIPPKRASQPTGSHPHNPHAEVLAQRMCDELRKLYGPAVLAALKRLL